MYYQSEAQLAEDEEALEQLHQLVVETYIQDVNSVYYQVSVDKNGYKNRAKVNLPIHQMLLKSINNIQIYAYDGFLLIEAEPKKFER